MEEAPGEAELVIDREWNTKGRTSIEHSRDWFRWLLCLLNSLLNELGGMEGSANIAKKKKRNRIR